MKSLLMLKCSDIIIPLNNRVQLSNEEKLELRKKEKARRDARNKARKVRTVA